MPYIETVDELADTIADWLGIYSDPRCDEPAQDWTCPEKECPDGDEGDHCHTALVGAGPDHGVYEVIHIDNCRCRVHWVPNLTDRMRAALLNEQALERGRRNA